MKPQAVIAILASGMMVYAGSVPATGAPKMGSAAAAPGIAPVTHPKSGANERRVLNQALLERYRRNARKLDSLAGLDSSGTRPNGSTALSRLMGFARTRQDHTQYAINLLGFADTTDPTAWEVAHARAADSLDSLEKALKDIEYERLQPTPPTSLPSPGPKPR
jgi:hypothetical protein